MTTDTASKIGFSKLARIVGVDPSFLSMILHGTKKCPEDLACELVNATNGTTTYEWWMDAEWFAPELEQAVRKTRKKRLSWSQYGRLRRLRLKAAKLGTHVITKEDV